MSRLFAKTLTVTAGLALVASLAGCALMGSGNEDQVSQAQESPAADDLFSAVRQASFEGPDEVNEPAEAFWLAALPGEAEPVEEVGVDPAYSQPFDSLGAENLPIDLASALALGGADNLQIRLVRERVNEARLKLAEARILWVPSLQAGVGYNRHDGQLQETEGNVLDVDRNSLFMGGGATLGRAPIAGASSGPARLMVDLSLADVWFEKLAARQQLSAESAFRTATVNDTLLAIAVAYFELVEAHGLAANAGTGLAAANQMVDLTSKFAAQGQTAPSEVARAEAAQGLLEQLVQDAGRRTVGRSAELARLLRLDPQVTLLPAEEQVTPVAIVDESIPLNELMAQALANRPELRQYAALVAVTDERIGQEHWRPLLPHLAVGFSGGSFGGGPSGMHENEAGRADFDVLAAWEWQHLGIGNLVQQRQRESQKQQACLQYAMARDRVTAEVTTSAADVASYRRQIDSTASSVEAAGESLRLNLQRIRQGEGLPIELLQAIRAQTNSLDAYTTAVANYNRSQFELLRALGQPPS